MTRQLLKHDKKNQQGLLGTSSSADKIIEAAISLFSANGYNGTSIRDIARMTRMSLYNIYYHFGNKDGLLLAILRRSSEHLLDTLRQVSELNMDPLDRFKLLVKTHFDMANIHMKEARIFFLDEGHLSPEGHRLSRQFQHDILEIYRSQLQNLKELGYVKYEHITILVFNILGVINWHLRWYRPEGPLSLEDLAKEIVRFTLHGALHNPALEVDQKLNSPKVLNVPTTHA
jgi:AcrR family transcriptional regulator